MNLRISVCVTGILAAVLPARNAISRPARPLLTNVRRKPALRCTVKDPPAARACRTKRTKKARWLCLKAARRRDKKTRKKCFRHARLRRPGRIKIRGSHSGKRRPKVWTLPARATRHGVVNMVNVHTREVLAVFAGLIPNPRLVRKFLRCRWTDKTGRMDLKVLGAVIQAARHFGATVVKVLSGYRHPKFNEYLRKKCRQVARHSRHTTGRAIDFALKGVDTNTLYQYLMSLKFGGVGTYPGSGFVHLDSGPVRTWKGL